MKHENEALKDICKILRAERDTYKDLARRALVVLTQLSLGQATVGPNTQIQEEIAVKLGWKPYLELTDEEMKAQQESIVKERGIKK